MSILKSYVARAEYVLVYIESLADRVKNVITVRNFKVLSDKNLGSVAKELSRLCNRKLQGIQGQNCSLKLQEVNPQNGAQIPINIPIKVAVPCRGMSSYPRLQCDLDTVGHKQ